MIPVEVWDRLRSPTPLVDAKDIASQCGIARLFIKNESERALGNFKSLGGVRASLCALARVTDTSLDDLLAGTNAKLPPLIAASAGNHGLAVATGASLAGARCTIYVHDQVPLERAERIVQTGATLIKVNGTYDDAVEAAALAAASGEALLIADTSTNVDDPVVADVMAGYQQIATEIAKTLDDRGERLTHAFVQAGVGGLAAAIGAGLHEHVSHDPWLVIVEPSSAACVAMALAKGRSVQLAQPLATCAGMLACGAASAPALATLLRHNPATMSLADEWFEYAVEVLKEIGIQSTPSGAAGLAGLLAATSDFTKATDLGIGRESVVLVIATEGA